MGDLAYYLGSALCIGASALGISVSGCADLTTLTVIGYCAVPVLVLVTAILGLKPT
jgi:hypothetical protein